MYTHIHAPPPLHTHVSFTTTTFVVATFNYITTSSIYIHNYYDELAVMIMN